MGIQSTQYITREKAINRITMIHRLIKEEEYSLLRKETWDTNHSVKEFINSNQDFSITNIEKWADEMLEEVMDKPFFRLSMFDNYLIREED
jgi:hypothetical protein